MLSSQEVKKNRTVLHVDMLLYIQYIVPFDLQTVVSLKGFACRTCVVPYMHRHNGYLLQVQILMSCINDEFNCIFTY